ncbi:MAG: polysaccharide deacetylase family protein [Flavobacteriaceae bacterium]|nr:polysaccharide deacetylase family protein [Flavobacteriaceae bacterium]
MGYGHGIKVASVRLMNYGVLIVSLALGWGCKQPKAQPPSEPEVLAAQSAASKPRISFTFDDGITTALAGIAFEEWDGMLLDHLEAADLKAVFFVTGKNKTTAKGRFLLQRWNDKGHRIANHTFSHPNFNAAWHTAALFEDELLKTDAIISGYSQYTPLFRFPYLKEGGEAAKVDSIRQLLTKHGYRNGYVTVDASDWYINQRLVKAIATNGLAHTQVARYREYYVQHLLDRATYYEQLSQALHGRTVSHTLLLHHNLTSALFLGDLIKAFENHGWEVTNADTAFEDPIYQQFPDAPFAGESLIYSQAKASGRFIGQLRYPAEDSRYEKETMDEWGL